MMRGARPHGSRYLVQILWHNDANASHKSDEYLLKAKQSLFQLVVSSPEGLAAPFIFKTVDCIRVSSILSKITG